MFINVLTDRLSPRNIVKTFYVPSVFSFKRLKSPHTRASNKYWFFKKISFRLKNNFFFNVTNDKKTLFLKTDKPTQKSILFLKKKFGLLKQRDFREKKIKKKLIFLKTFISGKRVYKTFLKSQQKRTPHIIFYKKIKRMYYRSARGVLRTQLNLKKYLTQLYLTKKITKVLKSKNNLILRHSYLWMTLLKTKLFFSFFDAATFIKTVGVLINNRMVYDPKHQISFGEHFSFVNSAPIYRYVVKQRHNVLKNLRRIKFYKYRSKTIFSKKKFLWLPSTTWINKHLFLYTNRLSNIEFDAKTLTGIYIYKSDFINTLNMYEINTLSLYMMRSYNWKYLT